MSVDLHARRSTIRPLYPENMYSPRNALFRRESPPILLKIKKEDRKQKIWYGRFKQAKNTMIKYFIEFTGFFFYAVAFTPPFIIIFLFLCHFSSNFPLKKKKKEKKKKSNPLHTFYIHAYVRARARVCACVYMCKRTRISSWRSPAFLP